MVCLGLKPGAAGWKAQMNPLSYDYYCLLTFLISGHEKPVKDNTVQELFLEPCFVATFTFLAL